jgi:hypothetical protein
MRVIGELYSSWIVHYKSLTAFLRHFMEKLGPSRMRFERRRRLTFWAPRWLAEQICFKRAGGDITFHVCFSGPKSGVRTRYACSKVILIVFNSTNSSDKQCIRSLNFKSKRITCHGSLDAGDEPLPNWYCSWRRAWGQQKMVKVVYQNGFIVSYVEWCFENLLRCDTAHAGPMMVHNLREAKFNKTMVAITSIQVLIATTAIQFDKMQALKQLLPGLLVPFELCSS